MKVFVICCNDSVKYAVIEDEKKAQIKMAELGAESFELNKHMFKDRTEYDAVCYWHIQEVNGE